MTRREQQMREDLDKAPEAIRAIPKIFKVIAALLGNTQVEVTIRKLPGEDPADKVNANYSFPKGRVSLREAAIRVLQASSKPLHYREITRIALAAEMVRTEGDTPQHTINAIMSQDFRNNKKKSVFVRMGKGVYGLRGVHDT